MVMRVSDLLPQNGAWYSVTRAFGGVASRRANELTSRPANGGAPPHLVNTVQDLSARGTCSPRRLAGGSRPSARGRRRPRPPPPPGGLRSTATNTSRLPVRPGVTPRPPRFRRGVDELNGLERASRRPPESVRNPVFPCPQPAGSPPAPRGAVALRSYADNGEVDRGGS